MVLLMIFLWGAIGAVAYSDLLPFWMLIVGGVLVSIAIIGMSLFVSNNKPGTTTTADTSGGDDNGNPVATSVPTAPANSSTNWGKIIAVVITVALFIGTLFVWAPWDNKNISPAINKADREMMAQGWQKIAVADVGGGYYSFEIPEGLTPGHKIKFQTVSWEMQRLSSGKEVDTCRGEWCTNYFFPAGVSIKDTPLYLKTKNPPRDFEWVKILPLQKK